MREITLELLKLLIMVAVALITRYVIPWIKEKTNNEVMQSVIELTMQAVLAAEQMHQASGDGATRKAIVTDFLKRILRQKDIAISDEELDMLIEAAVKEMNLSAGK